MGTDAAYSCSCECQWNMSVERVAVLDIFLSVLLLQQRLRRGMHVMSDVNLSGESTSPKFHRRLGGLIEDLFCVTICSFLARGAVCRTREEGCGGHFRRGWCRSKEWEMMMGRYSVHPSWSWSRGSSALLLLSSSALFASVRERRLLRERRGKGHRGQVLQGVPFFFRVAPVGSCLV